MRVAAVVLHYKFWPEVQRTLDALVAQSHPLEHVVVVDNNSADGSAEALGTRLAIELVRAPTNGGYAAGMNIGLRLLWSRPIDAVLLLTHEAVLDPDGLRRMVEHLETDPGVGAVGPLLAWGDRPDTVYSAGVSIDPRTWYQDHLGSEESLSDWTSREPHLVDSLDGAALLIRRAAAEATGVFDEDYFLYFEEVDYFVRMRRAGWEVACVCTAIAVQQPGRHPQALWVRNSLKLLANHAPRRVLAREFGRNGYQLIRETFRGEWAVARERLVGMMAFLGRCPASSLAGRS